MISINLMKGDCLERMKEIPDKSVDMVLTDPPYGTTACKWDSVIDFRLMWIELKRIVKNERSAIVLFGSEPFSSALRMSNIKEFKYDWYWNKTVGGNPLNAKNRPLSIFETLSVFYSKPCKYYPQMTDAIAENVRPVSRSKQKTDIVGKMKNGFMQKSDALKRFPKNELIFSSRNLECNPLNRSHPTQKPVALLEYLIKTYTLENETVLDFTMGSGSTGVACKNLNRNFIGIERDDRYFEIASKRIEEA